MKIVLFVLSLVLVTTSAQADGFICQGEHNGLEYRAKVFNHINAEDGTKNPSVLIVSSDPIFGSREEAKTVAALYDEEISKTNLLNSIVYNGVTNGKKTSGRFVSVEVEVAKDAFGKIGKTDMHEGSLKIVADGETIELDLICERYLKQQR
jgi:hypothetical protein